MPQVGRVFDPVHLGGNNAGDIRADLGEVGVEVGVGHYKSRKSGKYS
jgi:hypothetical protein